jgi:hypothetical protein
MINGEGKYFKNGKPINCVWFDDVKFELEGSNNSDRIICAIVL